MMIKRKTLRRKSEEVLAKASEIFDLPADIIAGAARVEIIGGREAIIENHGGILEYTDELVRIAGSSVVIELRGAALVLESMSSYELKLRGRIFGVEFRY